MNEMCSFFFIFPTIKMCNNGGLLAAFLTMISKL